MNLGEQFPFFRMLEIQDCYQLILYETRLRFEENVASDCDIHFLLSHMKHASHKTNRSASHKVLVYFFI